MRPRLPRLLAALAALASALSLALVARAEIYMFVPGITGEVTQPGHVGWIEIITISHGFAHLPPAATAPLTVTKLSDSTSPRFFEALVNGTNLGTIEFAERTSSSNGLRTLKIQPANLIRMQQFSDAPGLTDLLMFRFNRFDMIESDTTHAWYDFESEKGQIMPAHNTAPTIAPVGNQTTNEDVAKNITVTIGDAHTPYSLSLTAASNNSTLIPSSRISITSSGTSRTVRLSPVTNLSGAALITLTVSDGLLSASTDFIFTVNPVNDPPTVASIPSQATPQNTPLEVPVTVGDTDTSLASVTLSGSSSNTAVLANSGIAFSGTGANRTMKLTPVVDGAGTATVSVTANDGTSNSLTRNFVFNVVLGPTAPSAITLTPNTVPENSAGGTVVGTLSATDPNPGDTHTFTLLDSAGGRFLLTGTTISVSGTPGLDFESATSHVLSVRATDSSSLQFTSPVTVNVSAVNEAPLINTAGAPGLQVVRGFSAEAPALVVDDPDASSVRVTLSSSIVNFTVAPPVSGVTLTNNGTGTVALTGSINRVNGSLLAGRVTFTPAAGQPPGAPLDHALQFLVEDLGSSGAGGPLSATATSNVRVFRHRIEQWREEHFTPAELANPALEATLWGSLADPDGDGANNVVEYSFARDPRLADASLAPVPVLAPGSDGQMRLHLAVAVRRDDPELAVSFVSSTDLTAWSAASVELVSVLPIDDAYELRTVRETTPVSGTTRRFLRGHAVLTLD